MTLVPSVAEQGDVTPLELPAEYLKVQVRNVLTHAVDGYRKRLKVYESLRNLNEVVGTEYGDRVLYELIQNAHDAHQSDDRGRIDVRLVVRSNTQGTLYVGNGGSGFRRKDVDAIMNIATTEKQIGEGIGNKGLGFRSVEALTDDVRIFSHRSTNQSPMFDGYCFRFATTHEIEALLCADGIDTSTARIVAATIPRYLVPLPLDTQPDEIVAYAQRGYETVIVVPLRTADAVALAQRQVRALADLEVPLLLFLDRIVEFRITIETPDAPPRRKQLTRRHRSIGQVPGLAGCTMHEVGVGQERRFLVVRREVEKARVIDAVERSIPRAPQIKRWRNWQGKPAVSVAVGLSSGAVSTGRFYNFLPMGEEAVSPLHGHLDAPFFAGIDRRDADFDLPLNVTLMNAAAEACAYAALHIAGKEATDIPQRAVFDLVAWIGKHAGKLETAFDATGTSLPNAPVVPVIALPQTRWATLSAVRVWPAVSLSLMKPRAVARRTAARLASPQLDTARLDRLAAMAKRNYQRLPPSGPFLAQLSEKFARSLADANAAPRTWSCFYEDLTRLFGATGHELAALAGKAVMLDRSGNLRPAGARDVASHADVFVRPNSTRRKRAKDGIPLPPSKLARRYRFLDEKIVLRAGTLNAFIIAGLVREYDPLEALAGLGSALGPNANDNRRREALTWAFRVWRTTDIADTDVQEALRSAKLHIQTSGGWRPAPEAAFSSSWTSVGRALENFLVDSSDTSPDCRRARDALLTEFTDWPTVPGGSKRQWLEFLEILGVRDGLKPVGGAMPEHEVGWKWNQVMRTGDPKEALDQHWCAEASSTSFPNPNTTYSRKGAPWRLPGQIEHQELSEMAKEAFQAFIFKHLETHSNEFLTFDVGRFERYQRDWNLRTLPTPLATFLRSAAWIAAGTHDEPGFRKASHCWASRTRQGRPPRFIHRLPDAVATLVEDSTELADLVFGNVVGLRDWHSDDTACERLQALAAVAPHLPTRDRRDFRKEYQRAWLDLCETNAALPRGLDLAVYCDGWPTVLAGDDGAPPTVIVTNNAQASEARILATTGHALLDIGNASAEQVAERLSATECFAPRQLDGVSVRLLVDGEPFVPRASDPPLTSLDLGWLPEVVLLGHELLAERLERGVQHVTVERRIRAIRVRRCRTISLLVDDQDTPPRDSMDYYGFADVHLPTLILSDRIPLDWKTLGRDLSGTISRLIDTRLRFLEKLLLRIALEQPPNTLEPPSAKTLAVALACDQRTLRELRAAQRTDLGHRLHLLMPVLVYFGDVALARQLASDAERLHAAFDLPQWLRDRFPRRQPSPEELVEACARVSDRSALRKELGLDYEHFNRALHALGEATLSSEAELRSIYDAYLRRMAPRIHERLRRAHAADYRQERDLTTYIERKTLAFLEFDAAWVPTRETLDNRTVEAHVARLLDQILGKDCDVDLPSARGLIERNRRTVRTFGSAAIPIIRIWCRHNSIAFGDPWRTEDPQSIARYLENAGLLDFEAVDPTRIPALCRRAFCWPENMPQTLDLATLGLDSATLEKEEEQRQKERQQQVIDLRSIEFAGTKLDTGDPSFADEFRQLAEKTVADDGGWYERSCRPRLIQFDDLQRNPPGSGGGTRSGRRRPPTEDQRLAMGLASEWLVFQFLQRRYDDAFDETCWISSNRAQLFGGSQGNDDAGYDFCVNTPQAEWLYEVKSSLDESGEFELTPNEMRVAASVPAYGRRRYRILYVPFVFSPNRWMVLELPNPMGQQTRNHFRQVGRGTARFRFERSTGRRSS